MSDADLYTYTEQYPDPGTPEARKIVYDWLQQMRRGVIYTMDAIKAIDTYSKVS